MGPIDENGDARADISTSTDKNSPGPIRCCEFVEIFPILSSVQSRRWTLKRM